MSNAQILGPPPDPNSRRSEDWALWQKSVQPAAFETLPGAPDRTAATAPGHRDPNIRQVQFQGAAQAIGELAPIARTLFSRIPDVEDAARSLSHGVEQVAGALAHTVHPPDPRSRATATAHAETPRPHAPDADRPTASPVVPTSPPNTVQLGAQAQAKTKTTSETSCPADPEELGLPAKTGRNQGDLPAALMTSTQTARLNAWSKDPTLQASGLAMFGPARNAPPPDDCATWQAHHLISVAQAQDPRNKEVFGAAIRAGWKLDEPDNLIGLPQNTNAQQMLHRTGLPDADRPLHDNAHQKDYKNEVERAVARVKQTLGEEKLFKTPSEYDQLAKKLLESEQAGLEKLVLSKRMNRLTEADRPHVTQEASAANPSQQLTGVQAVATSMHAAGDRDASARAVWFQSVGLSPTESASSEAVMARSRGQRLG